jgi:hypothetical protein
MKTFNLTVLLLTMIAQTKMKLDFFNFMTRARINSGIQSFLNIINKMLFTHEFNVFTLLANQTQSFEKAYFNLI